MSDKNITEWFGDYEVMLEITDEGDGPMSHCYIEHQQYSASLECADSTGMLDGPKGEEPISNAMLNKIRKWAELNGY